MALYQGNVFSKALGMITQLTVLYPDYPWDIPVDRENEPPKVLFALHGATGNASDWVRMTAIEYYARRYNYAVVLPEVQLGFYTNMRYGYDYLRYVGEELPQLVSRTFRLDTSRKNLFVAGLSMGGYGALKVGLTYPETFGGIASFSAAVDIVRLLNDQKTNPNPMLDNRVLQGVFGEELKAGTADDLFALIRSVAARPDRPVYLQTCGTQDFLYEDNQKWKRFVEDLGYGHTFLEWKDGHTYPFWDRSVEFAMRFFAGEKVSADDASAFGYGHCGDCR